MPYQILGVDPTQIVAATGTPEFPLGQIAEDESGNRYMYVRANGAVVADFPVAVDSAFDVADGAGVLADGIAMATLADNEYGWMKISGVHSSANVETGVTAGQPLSYLADGNGDFQGIAAAYAVTGESNLRAKALTAESGGLADVLLLAWV